MSNVLNGIQLEKEIEESFILGKKDKQAKDNVIIGDYNEYLAKKYFRKKGFNVIKLVMQVSTADGSGKQTLNEIEVMKYCRQFGQDDLFEYLIKTSLAGLPDFLCINEAGFFFAECKCDPQMFKGTQQEKINELKGKDYEVKIFSTPIKLGEISYGCTTIYAIK